MPTRFYEYTLTLQAPALLSTAEGDPNSVLTALSIPGSAIRGAVAAALKTAHPRFHEIVLSGAVRFLNVYPTADRQGGPPVRALPTPRSWRANKDNEHQVFDFSAAAERDEDLQYMPAGVPFATMHTRAIGVRPRLRRDFHQARDRVQGRSTDREGAIFVYEAIEARTAMSGILSVAGKNDEEIAALASVVKECLTTFRVGRSRLSQYGGEARVDGWQEPRSREDGIAARLPQVVTKGTRFRLLLTADAIVRSRETGQVDPGALDAIIESALSPHPDTRNKFPAEVRQRFASSLMVSGFNSAWRLPVQQVPAVAAGSLLVLEATEDIPLDTLLAVEGAGIGERRIEGFGAVLFLTDAQPKVDLTLPDARGWKRAPRPPGAPPISTLDIQRRLFDGAIQHAVETYATSLVRPVGAFPSRALLGRLRAALRAHANAPAPRDHVAGLRSLLSDGEQGLKRTARSHLGGFRFDGTYLDTWLGRACNEPESFSETLFAGADLDASSIDGQVDAALRRDLARRAMPQLVDAVLALLSKKAQKLEGGSRA